ncbi:unnamed protein product [Durusdinium trenchii]|uniref:Uncharacterized protein n=1 Tax=Durusdinium trenchii TaxID=1381693 RepID=A0ABP0QYE2_9DINO
MYMFFLDQVTKCLQCEGELSIVCSFTPSGEWPVTKPVWFRASTMGCFKADIQQKVKELQQLFLTENRDRRHYGLRVDEIVQLQRLPVLEKHGLRSVTDMYKAFEGPLNEDPRLIAKQAEIYTTLGQDLTWLPAKET